MAFERHFSDEAIKKLQQEPLFRDFLHKDIVENKTVFPAVRRNRIDFYHRGGNLFSYNGKVFRTNRKYASVLDYSKDYVTEADLEHVPPITSFADHYERIKENCAAYTKDEAESVSHLYNQFSCAQKNATEDVVVLDIEVSFENRDDDGPDTDRKRPRQDRVDILLYKTSEERLRFFEAKLFSNDEIRATGNAEPPVVAQMDRYRDQLKPEHHEHILTQYKNHVYIINRLFDSDLPEPTSIDPEPRLYVFGFDNDQKMGRLKNNREALQKHGVKVYAIGGSKRVDAETLWNKAT